MCHQTSTFYDNWVSRQIAVGINERHLAITDRIKKLCKCHSVKKILEIGCGIGTVTYLLHQLFPHAYILAIDSSRESIAWAQHHFISQKNIAFDCRDILTFESHESFDLIVFPDVLEHIPLQNHTELFRKIDKYLEKNGKIVIHIPAPNYLAYLHLHHPASLQPIDQPLFFHEWLPVLCEYFELIYLEQYAIWEEPSDYVFLLLEKKEVRHTYTPKQSSVYEKIWQRCRKVCNNFGFRYRI